MCNKKLIGARHFNRGLFALDPTLDFSMNSSRDISGHGTHTSTTAAGNYVDGASYYGYASGTARGVAPWARVAVYKALWGYDGACAQSDVLAAIDQAIMDGVDILSLSYGSLEHEPLFSETNSIATFAAMERGIFISASAGNSYNLLAVKNAAPWILTVAASTIDRELSGRVTLGNGVLVTGSSLYHGGLVSGYLVFMGRCLNSTGLDHSKHQIVVCSDNGDDGLRNQVGHVEYSGAYGGIFITDSLEVSDTMETSFPAVFLSSQSGEVIMDYMKSKYNAKATLEFQETSVGTKPAPRVADYSSRGPSRSCPFVLKPDLTAPGSLIIASWSQYIGDRSRHPKQGKIFNIESGTSMAAPHAAGVAALLRAVYPEWSPAAIRSAMMTTADVLDNTFKPIHEITSEKIKLATPLSMGAGHINPNKAMDPGLIYDIKSEDYVNLLCGLNFTKEQILTITRSSSYSCLKPTVDINYPSFIAFFSADGNNTTITKEFRRTVTYVGNGTSTFVAKLTPLNGLTASVVPDKMVFKEKNEKHDYKLNIEGPGQLTDEVVYGFLSWEETPGKHVVRSPIVITNIML